MKNEHNLIFLDYNVKTDFETLNTPMGCSKRNFKPFLTLSYNMLLTDSEIDQTLIVTLATSAPLFVAQTAKKKEEAVHGLPWWSHTRVHCTTRA